MKSNSLKWFQLFAVALCLVLVLSACSGNGNGNGDEDNTTPPAASENNGDETNTNAANTEEVEAEEELEFVELKWYTMSLGPLPDLATVQERVNEITMEKINATVEIVPIESGEIKDRMLAIMAAGEEYDIAWTGNWANNYAQNVDMGAYVPLDDLLTEYAPEVLETIPGFVFDATRIDGQIYGVPNYQTVTKREGYVIQKSLAEKYNLDVDSIKKMEDITPFLEQVKAGEPDMIPFGMGRGGVNLGHSVTGHEDIQSGVGIDINADDPLKAIITIGTEEHMNKLRTVYDWNQKGLINSDAAELANYDELVSTGKVAVIAHNVLYPGSEQGFANGNGGHEVVLAPLEEPWVSTSSIITTMLAISKTSKNPERAMMLINLLNTDKELYNTIVFGIEGKHYDFVSDGVIKVNPDGGYVTNGDWLFGNTFNRYLYEGEDPANRQAIQDENFSALPSPLMGFTWDRSVVDTERANISAIYDRFGPAMNTGLVDPDEIVPEWLEANKTAGIDTILVEVQKQIDAWKAANGK